MLAYAPGVRASGSVRALDLTPGRDQQYIVWSPWHYRLMTPPGVTPVAFQFHPFWDYLFTLASDDAPATQWWSSDGTYLGDVRDGAQPGLTAATGPPQQPDGGTGWVWNDGRAIWIDPATHGAIADDWDFSHFYGGQYGMSALFGIDACNR
jgi:hypothetical protein